LCQSCLNCYPAIVQIIGCVNNTLGKGVGHWRPQHCWIILASYLKDR